MPAASSDDARGASSAASVLAPSEGETEDPRISAYVAHLAHVGDEMAAGLGALFADAFPEVPTLVDIHEGFTFSKNDSLLLFRRFFVKCCFAALPAHPLPVCVKCCFSW